MDGLVYYGSLVVIALFIFSMRRVNNNFLAFIALLIGIYIVYSHETGHTATEFKNNMVDKINDEVPNYGYTKERLK